MQNNHCKILQQFEYNSILKMKNKIISFPINPAYDIQKK